MLPIKKVPGKPLAILNPAQIASESPLADFVRGINEFLSQQREPLYFILDMGSRAITFDTLIQQTNVVNRENHLFAHPMLRETIVVTGDPMLSLSVKGLNSSIFGNLRIKAVSTMEEATKYVDSQLISR